jgi:hypothetical protein
MPDQKNYPTASVSVSFSDSAASGGDGDSAELSLDSEKNLLVYGQEKTSFLSGEAAYLKLHCAPGYDLDCSAGVVVKSAAGIAYPYSEDLMFRLSRAESLQHLPMGQVDNQWIGKDGGSPLFSGKAVTIPEPKVAILRCEYKSIGDRLKLVVTHPDMGIHATMEVLVVVSRNGAALTSITVTYENGELIFVPVELLVSDFCSDEQVDGVEVFLDGFSIGYTNAEGKIYLGELMQGSQHTLKMIRTGYVDSDIDILQNDEFTVLSE